MAYILFGTADRLVTCPMQNISRIDYSKSGGGENTAVLITAYRVGGSNTTVYKAKGNESVVDDADAIYRKILDGLANDKPVNLSDFSLTKPKTKAKPKETPEEETTEEETPTEPETPPEAPAE